MVCGAFCAAWRTASPRIRSEHCGRTVSGKRKNLANGGSGAHLFCNSPNFIQADSLHKNSPGAAEGEAWGAKWKAGLLEEAKVSARVLAKFREKSLAYGDPEPDLSAQAILVTVASFPLENEQWP